MSARRHFDIREKSGPIAVLLIAWLAGNLVMAFLVNLPRGERAESLREAVERFQQRRVQRERAVGELRNEYRRIMDGQRSLRTFYNDVLSTKQARMTAVQREIRKLARTFHTNPETIGYPKEIFEKDQIVRFSAVMPLTGSYENLRQFISAVENSENFLTITGITLADSKEGGVILSLRITLSTYFFDPAIRPRGVAVARGA
jgi:Tfp pilus assembly protein PilO